MVDKISKQRSSAPSFSSLPFLPHYVVSEEDKGGVRSLRERRSR